MKKRSKRSEKINNRAIKNTKIKHIRTEVALKDMRLKDIKRECILRGMDFYDMVNSGIPKLQSWLINNYRLKRDWEKLNEFDKWMDDQLKADGNEDLIFPTLNLGYFEGDDEELGEDSKVTKRIKGINKKEKRKQRTEDGIFEGTKKALTFELAKKGLPRNEVVKIVIEKFPEAKEKSIGIWYNRAKK